MDDVNKGNCNDHRLTCRACGCELKSSEQTKPFCSERCRLNDLSKWFSENYRVAAEPTALSESTLSESKLSESGLSESSEIE